MEIDAILLHHNSIDALTRPIEMCSGIPATGNNNKRIRGEEEEEEEKRTRVPAAQCGVEQMATPPEDYDMCDSTDSNRGKSKECRMITT